MSSYRRQFLRSVAAAGLAVAARGGHQVWSRGADYITLHEFVSAKRGLEKREAYYPAKG
jgi:hypothetical protein